MPRRFRPTLKDWLGRVARRRPGRADRDRAAIAGGGQRRAGERGIYDRLIPNLLFSFNKGLGLFEVTEIPLASPGEPQIYVTFHVDARGELSITAWDEGTGRDLPVFRR
jgi:Hsp70 protein